MAWYPPLKVAAPMKYDEKTQYLRNLDAERINMENHIIRIKKGIVNKTMSLDPIKLECRLDMVNSYSEQLLAIQSKIEEANEYDTRRAQLEDVIVETKSLIKTILAENRTKITEDTLIAPHNPKLPKINLPKFDGEYAEYKNFMSEFEKLVHNDSTKSNIAKFNCLISSLSGEALDMIKSFKRTAENYPKALAKLKEKYDNKCLKFFDAIAKLFELPNITKPSALELLKMLESVSAIYNSLLSLGDEKNITNAIIIHLVMHKVDPATRSKFKEQLDYGKLPAWHDLETVLNKRYEQLSADEASTSSSRSPARGPILSRNLLTLEDTDDSE